MRPKTKKEAKVKDEDLLEEKKDLEEDDDEDVYTHAGHEKLQEDDEIEPWEEGFMEGAEEGGQLSKDALTGEPLMGEEDVVEMELEGKMYRFTSLANAEKFRKKMKEEKKKSK